jgi:hypothetical protein
MSAGSPEVECAFKWSAWFIEAIQLIIAGNLILFEERAKSSKSTAKANPTAGHAYGFVGEAFLNGLVLAGMLGEPWMSSSAWEKQVFSGIQDVPNQYEATLSGFWGDDELEGFSSHCNNKARACYEILHACNPWDSSRQRW